MAKLFLLNCLRFTTKSLSCTTKTLRCTTKSLSCTIKPQRCTTKNQTFNNQPRKGYFPHPNTIQLGPTLI